MDLITIGAFATLSGLSAKALRIYDDSGLLPPAHVDPSTGYRWYHRDQVPRARTIALLRGLEMPLVTVQEILDLPAPEAATALERYGQAREQRHQGQRRLLTFLVDRFRERTRTMYEIDLREAPARTLLSVTEHLTADEVPVFYAQWCRRLGALELDTPADGEPPFLRYHGEISADSDGPVEFCCPITDETIDAARAAFPVLSVSREPAGHEAVVTVPVQDTHTPLGFEALHQWLADHGATEIPPVRQRFLAAVTDANDAPDAPAYELAAPVSPWPLVPGLVTGRS